MSTVPDYRGQNSRGHVHPEPQRPQATKGTNLLHSPHQLWAWAGASHNRQSPLWVRACERSQGRRDDADSGARLLQAVTTIARAVFGLGLLLRSPYRALRYPAHMKPTAEP